MPNVDELFLRLLDDVLFTLEDKYGVDASCIRRQIADSGICVPCAEPEFRRILDAIRSHDEGMARELERLMTRYWGYRNEVDLQAAQQIVAEAAGRWEDVAELVQQLQK